MSDPVQQFREALSRRGITLHSEIIADGRIHRCDAEGKNGKGDAAYLLHLNGVPAGGFQNWRDGLGWEDWRAEICRPLTVTEQTTQRAKAEATKRERATEEAKRHAEARKRAASNWNDSQPASADHPYLKAKGVQAHGLRQSGDKLVVPMRDAASELHSLQTIAGDGTKRFLPGGRAKGCYFAIGNPDGVLCIAEGYATGASVHEATGYGVAVAFDADNLESVARELRGKFPDLRLILCADDDATTAGNPGLTKATAAARAVGGFVAVPDFGADRPEGATDFNDLALHRGAEAVRKAIEAACAPDKATGQASGDNASGGRTESHESPEPLPDALDLAAFHGIAGEFVRMTEPHTEADPAAILVQFLTAFGALVGRGPHYRVESDQHHAHLYALLVGATAKGRKGTSWGRVNEVFALVPDWKPPVSGLSSGEGVKYHVRDAREETKANKRGELVTEQVDEGVTDKRLLVTEPEFASALRAAQRQGNTLSATIREGWDSGNLRTLTKNDPITATGAHICIVGHITTDELRAELTATDSANGFANRFLYVGVRRSKMLPFGGEATDGGMLQAISARLRSLAEQARMRGRIAMTETARRMWATVYPNLSAGADGLHGAVTARAEAQVVRLALVYALLDGAPEIDAPHLLAALAVWAYCDATAKHIFGASLGDRIADEVLRRLRQAGHGLTRNEIRDAFGRNVPADRIGTALDLLRARGRATCEKITTGGRAAEVWRVTK